MRPVKIRARVLPVLLPQWFVRKTRQIAREICWIYRARGCILRIEKWEVAFMRLGTSLSSARKKSGLSQEEVAEKLGVSRQTISKWETGVSLR